MDCQYDSVQGLLDDQYNSIEVYLTINLRSIDCQYGSV